MPESPVPVAEWAWQRQSIWSQTANKLKAGPHLALVFRMGFTVAAAAMALAGSQLKAVSLPASIVLAIAAALAMATVGVLRGLQDVEHMRRWTRARSVSEALKTEVFMFLSHAGAYDSPERERLLEAEVQRLENETGDLYRYTEGVEPVARLLPAVRDVDSYLNVRVRQSQLKEYYEPNARRLHH